MVCGAQGPIYSPTELRIIAEGAVCSFCLWPDPMCIHIATWLVNPACCWTLLLALTCDLTLLLCLLFRYLLYSSDTDLSLALTLLLVPDSVLLLARLLPASTHLTMYPASCTCLLAACLLRLCICYQDFRNQISYRHLYPVILCHHSRGNRTGAG